MNTPILASSSRLQPTPKDVARLWPQHQGFSAPPARKTLQKSHRIMPTLNCSSKAAKTPRRSANYHPTVWDSHFIESTNSLYSDERSKLQLEKLKFEAKLLLEKCEGRLARLQFIDSVDRLGVAYHFEREIKDSLGQVSLNDFRAFGNLEETALCFRLLRQHGHNVPSDVFNKYRDERGFKNCLAKDVKGLFSLYQASFLATVGEEVLEEAQEFSLRNLQSLARRNDFDPVEQVKYSTEIPLHWRMPRLEAQDFIHIYNREEGRCSVLSDLAMLDFNIVQSLHQKELRELSRWWNDLGLAEKLKFSRDRLVENYLWAVGITFEPQFSKCRMVLTKLICILTVIDDIYDVYGSLKEVELFTSTVKSWDIEAAGNLPADYLKLCYAALYAFVNETTNDIRMDYGGDVTHLCLREWERLCGAYLVEAEWFDKDYRPTLDEYLKNAWISVGGPLCMVYAYFHSGCPTVDKCTDCLLEGSKLVYWSSVLTRLSDDLGTSKAEMERGDTPKSVECHINETGSTREASIEYVKGLVRNSWKELNEAYMGTHLPRNFANMVLNMARTAQCIFESGDGIGISTGVTKQRITSLFFGPIGYDEADRACPHHVRKIFSDKNVQREYMLKLT